jgi:hypothetical protein
MSMAADRYPSARSMAVIGIAFTAVFVAFVIWLTNIASYREWIAPLVAAALVLISMPILARRARLDGDPTLFRFLLVALIVKFLVAVIRHILAFEVYDVADAVVYNREGTLLAEQFLNGNFHVDLPTFTDTDFIKIVTGVVYTFIGPTTWGGFIFFSWMAFWGSYLLYRSYTISIPQGKARSFARVLFFLPSMLYWPASLGKESWMLLALGVTTLGSAKILIGQYGSGLPLTVVGLAATWVVRPHIAGFVAIALAGAVVVRKQREGLRQLGPVVKVGSIAIVLAMAVVLAMQGTKFLEASGVDTQGGIASALEDVSERTSVGESTYSNPSLASPFGLPVAVVTVLYRPFVFEAHNVQARVSALEGVLLLVLSIVRIRWLLAAIKSVRKQPFVMFALVYVAASIVGLSSLSNFGLLARQRVLLYPLFLVLLTIPPLRERTGEVQDPA